MIAGSGQPCPLGSRELRERAREVLGPHPALPLGEGRFHAVCTGPTPAECRLCWRAFVYGAPCCPVCEPAIAWEILQGGFSTALELARGPG